MSKSFSESSLIRESFDRISNCQESCNFETHHYTRFKLLVVVGGVGCIDIITSVLLLLFLN